ncbi:MAG TPA: polysaccharide biosynthesis tyrosine autokinase [Xanthomonadaceae bacterium]|nr:polysaccharide biosynthesis tyrosine autokinase [Xanthomonadaceae bacterium]
MNDETLPAHAADDDAHLPARQSPAPGRALATGRAAALPVEVFEEGRGEQPDEIDLLAYWRILVKRRWLVLSVLAAAAALSLLLTLMTRPIYRATAVLQIENEGQQIVQVQGVSPVSAGWDPEFLQTQYELLKSRSLAERVADEINLDRATLDALNKPGWIGQVRALLRPAPKAAIAKSDAAADLATATGVVSGGISIQPIQDSRLVRVHYDSPLPVFAARVANAIAEGFIASGLERRFGASSYAKTYLEDQLKIVKGRLEDSERQLVAFAQKENLVTSGEDGQSLEAQNLSDLNSALAAAQDQRIRAQARWRQAAAAGGAALPADMLANSIVRTLQQQRAELQGRYQEKLQVFKPDYPEMQQLKGQLDELDKQIAGELRNIRASVKAEYDAAISQEGLLKGQLGSLRSAALDVDGRSIQYNILKREVDTNRQLYDGLLQRYKEVGVAGDVRSHNISIVDRAQVPGGPFKPSLSRNLAFGLLVGLILGVLVAFVMEYLDDTLKTPADIEQRLNMAVLGIIPKLGAKQTVAGAVVDPRSAFSEAYRSVRTALQFSTDHGVPKVLLVTSPGPSEGKSTTALALARNFAQLGQRVLLIEADLRNPSLHRTLDLHGKAGLSSLLAGASSIGETMLDTDDERLKVILAGVLPPNPAELLSGSWLVSILTVAAERFDQIVIDGPPVLGIADAPILSNVADGTLLVVHAGKTRIAPALAAAKRLLVARAHILGGLLTHYDAKAAGYGYAYNYDSYYAYGSTARLEAK